MKERQQRQGIKESIVTHLSEADEDVEYVGVVVEHSAFLHVSVELGLGLMH